jgi:hypothetical protein
VLRRGDRFWVPWEGVDMLEEYVEQYVNDRREDENKLALLFVFL